MAVTRVGAPPVLIYGRTALGAYVPVLVDADGIIQGQISGNPFDQDLNTTDAVVFASATIDGTVLNGVGNFRILAPALTGVELFAGGVTDYTAPYVIVGGNAATGISIGDSTTGSTVSMNTTDGISLSGAAIAGHPNGFAKNYGDFDITGDLVVEGVTQLAFPLSLGAPDQALFDDGDTALYIGTVDGLNSDIVIQNSGDSSNSFLSYASGGTLSVPTTAWSDDFLGLFQHGYVNGSYRIASAMQLYGHGDAPGNTAYGTVEFTMKSGVDLTTSKQVIFDKDGVITPDGGYKSSDGSAGISTTVTTASLVGKTITFKNGLVTAFA